MPDAGVVVHILPSGHAGKKRVHYHQFLRLGRKLCGVSVGDHQPDVVADDPRSLDTQRFRERVDSDGSILHVQPVGRDRGIADSRQVGRDHCKFRSQQWDNRPPHARGLGIAVQQNHRRAVTSRQVVQFDAVYLRRSRGDRFSLGGTVYRGCHGKKNQYRQTGEWLER